MRAAGGDRGMRRIARHLITTPWRARRAFPRAALQAIERAIEEGERSHAAEIRFAIEGALHGPRLLRGQSPRERALEVFSHLRMWDTEHRNGVLIYVLLADRAVEIIADRGAHARIESQAWNAICRLMEEAFRAGRYLEGAVNGIAAVSRLMAEHFPAGRGRGADELPNRPVVL
jgi:uncharacterized membrane protein